MTEQPMNELTYEQAANQLESAVQRLEKGDLSLEESIRIFEQAVGLVRLCNARLDEIEKRITILVEGKEEVREKDFLRDQNL
jgi:exodeoxyribonuclease VII small subunit